MEYFKTDTQISEPTDSSRFNLQVNLNGFGWDPDEGIFIPVDDGNTYFESPFPRNTIRKIDDNG